MFEQFYSVLDEASLIDSGLVRSYLTPADSLDHKDVQLPAATPAFNEISESESSDDEAWFIKAPPAAALMRPGIGVPLPRTSISDRSFPKVVLHRQAPPGAVANDIVLQETPEPTAIPLNSARVTSQKFQAVALVSLSSMLFLIRIAKWKIDFATKQKFERNKPLPYIVYVKPDQVKAGLKNVIDETFAGSPDLHSEALELVGVFSRARDPTATISAIRQAHEFHHRALKAIGALNFSTVSEKDHPGLVTFELRPAQDEDSDLEAEITWPAKYGTGLFDAVIQVAQALRDADEEPGLADFVWRTI